MSQQAIIVLGMHRSGTSAVTGALQRLGVELGADLMPAQTGVNERGFWEHSAIVDLHDGLLDALEYTWDDVRPLPAKWWQDARVIPFRAELRDILAKDFAATRLWGLKDPRMCRLMGLWHELLVECGCRPVFLHMFRDAAEVVASLQRRDGFTVEKAAYLWLDHNLAAERASRGYPRVFASFDQVLSDTEATLDRVGRALGVAWPRPVAEAMPDIAAFLSPQLRHGPATTKDRSTLSYGWTGALIERCQQTLDAASRGEPVDEALRDLTDRFDKQEARRDPVALAHIADLHRRLSFVNNRNHEARTSVSWRLTRPLRGFAHLGALISGRAP